MTDFRFRALAQKLVVDIWDKCHVDPCMLMCLVIPKNDLVRDTEWGQQLLDSVMGIIGSDNMQHLDDIIKEVRWFFIRRQMKGASPGPKDVSNDRGREGQGGLPHAAAAAGRVVDGFRKADVLRALQNLQQGDENAKLFAPSLIQLVEGDKKRSFRMYEHPQDMIVGVIKSIIDTNSPYVHIAEAAIDKSGVIRLYLDFEIYLRKMPCVQGDTLEERILKLESIADEMPQLWCRILVDLKVINSTDILKIIVKDNSRMLQGGDYGLKRHLVSDALVTRRVYEHIQMLTFDWIREHCPLAYAKMRDQDAVVSKEDSIAMTTADTGKSLVALTGIDPACKSSLQMLRLVWTKKNANETLVSRLHSSISVRDGKRLDDTMTAVPDAYTPLRTISQPPDIHPGRLGAALWDTLVFTPSPYCRGVNEMALRTCNNNRPSEGRDGGGRTRNQARQSAGRADRGGVAWAGMRCDWFKEWCHSRCGNEGLPPLRTNVQGYAVPPPGYEDGMLVQVNHPKLSLCSLKLMSIPTRDIADISLAHKSNGTVFLLQGDQVWLQCMDPVCRMCIQEKGEHWYQLAKQMDRGAAAQGAATGTEADTEGVAGLLEERPGWWSGVENRARSTDGKWWARLPQGLAAKLCPNQYDGSSKPGQEYKRARTATR